jgi:hypothetical protein
MEFIKTNLDKMLLVGLILYFVTMQTAMLHRFPNLDQATLQWIEKSSDLCLGAFIGIITSQRSRVEAKDSTVVEVNPKEK